MKEEKKNRIAAYKAAKKCGGCQYQGIPYEKQLQDKQKAVRQLMQSFCKTTEITGMKDPYHYRNKVHAVFARKKDGTIISGVYEADDIIACLKSSCTGLTFRNIVKF